jgi:hypothetical protein
LDIAVRAGGAVVAVWGAALFAAYGAFLTPFRVGQVLVPVSVLVALCSNAVLAWFAYRTTRNRFLGLLPGLVWVIVTFRWADPSTEGDLVLANTWVATSYVFLGAAPVVVAAYRWFLAAPPTRPGPSVARRRDET